MAQAFFEQLADGPHTAASAGTHAGTDLNPIVVEVMREVGVDLSDRKPGSSGINATWHMALAAG
jgi:arsenate reductase